MHIRRAAMGLEWFRPALRYPRPNKQALIPSSADPPFRNREPSKHQEVHSNVGTRKNALRYGVLGVCYGAWVGFHLARSVPSWELPLSTQLHV